MQLELEKSHGKEGMLSLTKDCSTAFRCGNAEIPAFLFTKSHMHPDFQNTLAMQKKGTILIDCAVCMYASCKIKQPSTNNDSMNFKSRTTIFVWSSNGSKH